MIFALVICHKLDIMCFMKVKISKYYDACTTRGRARKVRDLILGQMSSEATELIIDLTRLEFVSLSFLDELIVVSIMNGIFAKQKITIVSDSPTVEKYIRKAANIRNTEIKNISIKKERADGACVSAAAG